ncbi:MAG: TetR/AcrR family transcriptional regulator [Chitinivibrionales bacterium]|nr:TetR/AcrR family transcriptional regulator [Chitinivibrionales bacterium]
MKSTKHETNTTTEQMILEAAEQLFLDKGFSMTSTTEIARKVGCNQALVHYYFRTKDRLFAAIFERKVRLFASTFLQIGNQDIPFTEKLQRKIELHFDILRANPKLPFLVFNEVTTNPKRLLLLKEKLGDALQSVIHQLNSELSTEIKKGIIRPISAIDLLLTIVSLNVALFIARPIFKTVTTISDKEFEKMVEHRKKENVTIILNSLRPCL